MRNWIPNQTSRIDFFVKIFPSPTQAGLAKMPARIVRTAVTTRPRLRKFRALLRSETVPMTNLLTPYARATPDIAKPSSVFVKPSSVRYGPASVKFFLRR